jgi:hypothetical protein
VKNPELFVCFSGDFSTDITLRDLFAAAAMNAYTSTGAVLKHADVAELSYMLADAMLAAREVKP